MENLSVGHAGLTGGNHLHVMEAERAIAKANPAPTPQEAGARKGKGGNPVSALILVGVVQVSFGVTAIHPVGWHEAADAVAVLHNAKLFSPSSFARTS